ncbi:MAG: DNA polymerase III subunit delta [Schwartzia sp. (in: firmicutes)]
MQYGEFTSALRQGRLRQVYLLTGKEPYFIAHAKRRILQAICPDEAVWTELVDQVEGHPSIPAIIERLTAIPFFTPQRVYLFAGTRLFGEGKSAEGAEGQREGRSERDMARLMETLAALPPSNYVIFETAGKVDKRRKLYKAVQKVGLVLEADPVTAWTIDGWLRDKLAELGRDFDREARAYFMEAVSVMRPISLSFLDQELTKLALYTAAKRFTREDLERAFSRLPEVSGFALFDAIDAREVSRALSILERQIADGVYLPLLLAGLVRHVRTLLQAKEHLSHGVRGKALAGALELHPFVAEKVGKVAPSYETALLRRVFLHLADADYALKTGQAGAEVLEEAVIALCRRTGCSRPFQTLRAE